MLVRAVQAGHAADAAAATVTSGFGVLASACLTDPPFRVSLGTWGTATESGC